MSNRSPRVFIVDDDTSLLSALTRLLRASGYDACPFPSAAAFFAEHDASAPGCLLLDLSLPDTDGIEVQRQLILKGDARPVIFLTGHGDVPTSVRAMREGAEHFLEKPVDEAELLETVRQAIKKDARLREAASETREIEERLQTLTPRERQVLGYVISGRLNKQIAAELGTVEKTVKVHRARVMQKMRVRSVAELVRATERVGVAGTPAGR